MNPSSPADTIRRGAASLRTESRRYREGDRDELLRLTVADWLDAELLVHQQAGALAAAAASGEVHIGGELVRVEVGLSTFGKALAVARAALGEAEHG